ncbi:MAG: hypothetical protein JRD05_04540 [Deltaproteobacteria bacterium]|nr:hypothetical protein [Deltaproteobacteria bacterium]
MNGKIILLPDIHVETVNRRRPTHSYHSPIPLEVEIDRPEINQPITQECAVLP